jgi:hypothetical protein
LIGNAILGFFFIICALVSAVAAIIVGRLFDLHVTETLVDLPTILALTVVGTAYVGVRRWVRRRPSVGSTSTRVYGVRDRLVHRLALASAARAEVYFDLESAFVPKPAPDTAQARHVYVVGLARAGTTMLMREIYQSGDFASLTYRDMPFVLAPNLWARVTGRFRKDLAGTERAHGDGVLVDADSPEALEEPFWRCFEGDAYIRPGALVRHAVPPETVEKYRRFVAHVLTRHASERYLAKNNNAVLRIGALVKAFPNATIIVPFRSPLDQAASLRRQHERFAADPDPFTRDYMRWLAHHEFGQDHRPFVFGNAPSPGTPAELHYWLSIWFDTYFALAGEANAQPTLVPIAYEDLCAPDRAAWRALCARISIDPGEPCFEARHQMPATESVPPSLICEAESLYQSLRRLSRQRLKLDQGFSSHETGAARCENHSHLADDQ